jgi:hypothetical protein
MRHANPARLHQQVSFLRPQFAHDGDLPSRDVLPEELVTPALAEASASWVGRIFSPPVTPRAFLSQVLSAGHSCRAAVARLIAHRVARGQKPCPARAGTPEAFRPKTELRGNRSAADLLPPYHRLLQAVAAHRGGGRPDRCEPRVGKHRRNHYGWPTKPRSEVKRKMAKGVTEI